MNIRFIKEFGFLIAYNLVNGKEKIKKLIPGMTV